jgi:hypothetical protein
VLGPAGVQAHLYSAGMFLLRMHIIYMTECAPGTTVRVCYSPGWRSQEPAAQLDGG